MFAWLKSNCMLKRLFPFNIIAFPSPPTCGNENPRRLSLSSLPTPFIAHNCAMLFILTAAAEARKKVLVQIFRTLWRSVVARLKWQPRKCLCFHVCASLKHFQKHELSLSSCSRLPKKKLSFFRVQLGFSYQLIVCVCSPSYYTFQLLLGVCTHLTATHCTRARDCLACNKNVFGGMAHRVGAQEEEL